MQKTGTVDRIRCGTCCFIKVPGEPDRFAHRNDFISKKLMRVGERVKFDPIEVKAPGKHPYAAINVEAA